MFRPRATRVAIHPANRDQWLSIAHVDDVACGVRWRRPTPGDRTSLLRGERSTGAMAGPVCRGGAKRRRHRIRADVELPAWLVRIGARRGRRRRLKCRARRGCSTSGKVALTAPRYWICSTGTNSPRARLRDDFAAERRTDGDVSLVSHEHMAVIRRGFFALLLAIVVAAGSGASSDAGGAAGRARLSRHRATRRRSDCIDTLLFGVRPSANAGSRDCCSRRAHTSIGFPAHAHGRSESSPPISRDMACTRIVRSTKRQRKPCCSTARFVAAPVDPNGVIDAVINPLAANRGGRPLAERRDVRPGDDAFRAARTLPRGVDCAAPLGARFARSGSLVRPTSHTPVGRIQTPWPAHCRSRSGAMSAVFGQSPTGGLLLSPSAPSLDIVRVSNDRPWTCRSSLGSSARCAARCSSADLGTRQIHPHSKLVGYHLAALPHPQFELGVEVIDAMGGRGGQPATFSDRVLDAIPLIDALRTRSDFQFSNKMAGLDVRWRMPRWRGFELYAEGDVDDIDPRRLKSSFLEDGGYIAGVSLSCLAQCGALGRACRVSSDGHSLLHARRVSDRRARPFCSATRSGRAAMARYLDDRRRPGQSPDVLASKARSRCGAAICTDRRPPARTNEGFHFVPIDASARRKRCAGAGDLDARETTLASARASGSASSA